MRRKQNFESVFSRKFRCPFVFCLLLSLLPASFAFLSPFFFFCGAFTRLSFGRKRFCKTSEDRELFLKEVVVGSGTRFSLEFSGQSYMVFCVFLWSVTESRSFGYDLKVLISLHKLYEFHILMFISCQSCLGPLKLMTSQVVQGTWSNKGGYGRF